MDKNRTRQHGATLIATMVGLVISMVVILAMLTVYKTTTRVTGEAGRSAATDGQRLAGLFAAQTLLQGAGYGITTAKFGTDLIVLSGAAMSGVELTGTLVSASPTNGNAIVWGGVTAGTGYMCSGLYAPAAGGLIRLPATACASAESWDTVAWQQIPLVTEQRLREQDKTADRAVSIQVRSGSTCQPFGITGSGNLQVVLQTYNSTTTGLPVTATTCLSNF
jgi:hypothetical protein